MSIALTGCLPTSRKEMDERGWLQADVILFSGDAYVDHPSFGIAVIGRVLEAEGLKVAIVPQPNWRDDLRDFRKLGAPRLFFGVSAGSMDSMVNHYTAARRLRSDDAYSAGGKAGFRPDYAATVYASTLKRLYPNVPVVLGGIEASLRRLTHYDYWKDALQPSILESSGADLLVYGMGEHAIVEVARRLAAGETDLTHIPQTAFLADSPPPDYLMLHSADECMKDKRKFAENFCRIEKESNKKQACGLIEPTGKRYVVVHPPLVRLDEASADRPFDLPYTRLPHPRYRDKRIPAYEMIRHSVNIHRGCFGGCSFCTISAHQGRFVASRSERSIMGELQKVTQMPDFKGYISDLGGPSANMYGMAGRDDAQCKRCSRYSCIYPRLCANLNMSPTRLLKLYRAARRVEGIKKIFIGSGVRYDLLLDEKGFLSPEHEAYFEDLVRHHVSGRLKVAPEHSSPQVLEAMRKPSFRLFERLHQAFIAIDRRYTLRQQLIPYFISGHPACRESDMHELTVILRRMKMRLPEQVQDFTPTPMTLSSVMFYCGFDPYTGRQLFVARSKEAKQRQKEYFFK